MENLRSNSIILVKELIRLTRRFEIFLIYHYADDIGNKNVTSKYQKILSLVSPILS